MAANSAESWVGQKVDEKAGHWAEMKAGRWAAPSVATMAECWAAYSAAKKAAR